MMGATERKDLWSAVSDHLDYDGNWTVMEAGETLASEAEVIIDIVLKVQYWLSSNKEVQIGLERIV